MKKMTYLIIFLISSLVLSACSNKKETGQLSSQSETTMPASDSSSTQAVIKPSHSTETTTPLTNYTDDQIEYARVWLTLGANQAIDELNIRLLPAGTLINPNDETSSRYPTDVIQLQGSRLVDGSITYKSNGDGTIIVYKKIPQRWEIPTPDKLAPDYMEELTESMIDEGEVVAIPSGDKNEIGKLITLQIQH